ncbi:MAG: hypothetical protein WDO74_11415 [Pseudomonadota bacterium]
MATAAAVSCGVGLSTECDSGSAGVDRQAPAATASAELTASAANPFWKFSSIATFFT